MSRMVTPKASKDLWECDMVYNSTDDKMMGLVEEMTHGSNHGVLPGLA
jgi:hypothetical protein